MVRQHRQYSCEGALCELPTQLVAQARNKALWPPPPAPLEPRRVGCRCNLHEVGITCKAKPHVQHYACHLHFTSCFNLSSPLLHTKLVMSVAVAVLQGFISPQHKNLVVSDDPEALIQQLQQWQPPASNVLADAASRAAAVGEDISQASDA